MASASSTINKGKGRGKGRKLYADFLRSPIKGPGTGVLSHIEKSPLKEIHDNNVGTDEFPPLESVIVSSATTNNRVSTRNIMTDKLGGNVGRGRVRRRVNPEKIIDFQPSMRRSPRKRKATLPKRIDAPRKSPTKSSLTIGSPRRGGDDVMKTPPHTRHHRPQYHAISSPAASFTSSPCSSDGGWVTRAKTKVQKRDGPYREKKPSDRVLRSAVLDKELLFSKDWSIMIDRDEKLQEKVEYDLKSFTEKCGGKPTAGAYETDMDVLMKRQKLIEIGKASDDYKDYVKNVHTLARKPYHPKTPNKVQKVSRTRFERMVKMWKKMVHHWNNKTELVNIIRNAGERSETYSGLSSSSNGDSAVSSLHTPSTTHTPLLSRSASMIEEDEDEDVVRVTPLMGDKFFSNLDEQTSSTVVCGDGEVDDTVMGDLTGFVIHDAASLPNYPHLQHLVKSDEGGENKGCSAACPDFLADDNAMDVITS